MKQTISIPNKPIRGNKTSARATKRKTLVHPHNFPSFQKYCSGAKENASVKLQNKSEVPIPEQIILEAGKILTTTNQAIIERLFHLAKNTTSIPIEFMEQEADTSIEQYLVDWTMLRILVDAKVINWNTCSKNLFPIRTSGNGNCLLHAILIAIAGAHDFDLYLHDRLTQFMHSNQSNLKERWRIQRLKNDNTLGLTVEDAELDSEWKELCDLTRYENSEEGQAVTRVRYLEAVHIFSISNMLHRPITVLSKNVVRNKHDESISSNDPLGIYLPVFISPSKCVRDPIVLAYDSSQFWPLQPFDDEYQVTATTNQKGELDNTLPLYQSFEQAREQNLLPVHFLGSDVSKIYTTRLLSEYLLTEPVSINFNSDLMRGPVLCARLGTQRLPSCQNFLLLYRNYVVGRSSNNDSCPVKLLFKPRSSYDDAVGNANHYSDDSRSNDKEIDAASEPVNTVQATDSKINHIALGTAPSPS